MTTFRWGTICEKVIIDNNGVASLISLFSQFNVGTVTGEEIPSNAVAPKEWALFCIWDHEPSEIGTEFTEVVEVRGPDGNLFAPPQSVKVVPQPGRLMSQVTVGFMAVPVGRAGPVTTTIRLEKGGIIVGGPTDFRFDVVHSTGPRPA
jgi:hypothetical protein